MTGGEETLADRLRACAGLVGGGNALAKLLGMSRRTLENYLNGRSEPKATLAFDIAQAAGVRPEWLVTGKGPRSADGGAAEPRAGTIDERVFALAGSTVYRVLNAEHIRVAEEALNSEIARAYNLIVERAEDLSDLEEVSALLPWLETVVRKDIKAAINEAQPASGKASA